ncbi:MAG: sigma-24, subfamily [Acidobacteria bacterium]|nr:sigma-24, subfamily [Acidobacteriota bacterium]
MAPWIEESFKRCLQRYPAVQLSVENFQARVDEILLESQPAGDSARAEALSRIHVEDLFLATACAGGDRVAWEHFADEYLPLLRRFAAQACANSSEIEDLAQEIAARLITDKKRLGGYNGRGSLSGWLRVAVSHAAVDRFRRMKRQTSLEALEEKGNPVAFSDPNHESGDDAPDSRWGPIITGVVDDCLRSLPPRDRLLLSLYYMHGVPLRDIGRQFGIHEATASRWLDRLRRDLRKQVERDLRKKHGLRSSELNSLWKWVSASPLAETLAETKDPDSPGIRKKSATAEESGVIDKEECGER